MISSNQKKSGGLKMAYTLKGVIAVFEMILYILGIIPVSTNIDYGGETYVAPVIEEAMYIVENGESEFDIVIPDGAD